MKKIITGIIGIAGIILAAAGWACAHYNNECWKHLFDKYNEKTLKVDAYRGLLWKYRKAIENSLWFRVDKYDQKVMKEVKYYYTLETDSAEES